jgi:hypothetical protein
VNTNQSTKTAVNKRIANPFVLTVISLSRINHREGERERGREGERERGREGEREFGILLDQPCISSKSGLQVWKLAGTRPLSGLPMASTKDTS